MDMCEAMNIIVKTTAAEAHLSNELIERHNLILSEMLDWILEDNRIDLEFALAWCIRACKKKILGKCTWVFSISVSSWSKTLSAFYFC